MMRYHATTHHDLDIHITPPHSSYCIIGSATTVTHIPEQRHLLMPSFIEKLTHEHMHKRQTATTTTTPKTDQTRQADETPDQH
jgi:hypothetical protein